jgi:hypothetical protein
MRLRASCRHVGSGLHVLGVASRKACGGSYHSLVEAGATVAAS